MSFRSKWTPELKRAVVSAVLDYEWKVPAAVAAAHRGQLPGIGAGLPPAEIPIATVRDLVTTERHRRRTIEKDAQDPTERMSAQAAELLELADKHVRRGRRLSNQGKLTPDELGKIARAVKDVHAAAAQAQGRKRIAKGRAKPEESDTAENEGNGFVDSLAAR